MKKGTTHSDGSGPTLTRGNLTGIYLTKTHKKTNKAKTEKKKKHQEKPMHWSLNEKLVKWV